MGGSGARYSGVMYRSVTEEIMLAAAAAAAELDLAAAAPSISCAMLLVVGGEDLTAVENEELEEEEEEELTAVCSSIVIIWVTRGWTGSSQRNQTSKKFNLLIQSSHYPPIFQAICLIWRRFVNCFDTLLCILIMRCFCSVCHCLNIYSTIWKKKLHLLLSFPAKENQLFFVFLPRFYLRPFFRFWCVSLACSEATEWSHMQTAGLSCSCSSSHELAWAPSYKGQSTLETN